MAGNGEYNAREISIHALLAESDMSSLLTDSKDVNFYPRSPCGERLCQLGAIQPVADISIHALLAESDLRVVDGSKSSIISIHALLAESDRKARPKLPKLIDFYPRSPCGERHGRACAVFRRLNFYPRSPCGERPKYFTESVSQ